MVAPVKVDFLSILKDPKEKKWYHSYARPLKSAEVAENLQELIDTRAHQGYEFVQIVQSWGNPTPKGKSDLNDTTHYSTRPDGLLVMFKKV